MKKQYMTPETEVVRIQNLDTLCGGLNGWSANNESDGSQDSSGGIDTGEDPDWGVAGAKPSNAWSSFDE